MKPSVTEQVSAEWVDARLLKPSPRSYNASTCCIHGKVWMAYRSHRMDKGGKCGIAICELDDLTPQKSQWLDLGGATGFEHHEDPRLFVFNEKLHVSFSETTFPQGRPYISVQKYARLERANGGWKVAEVFRPRYGRNYSDEMEKNWMFFEHDGQLHAIYSAAPHVVIELRGDQVVKEHRTAPLTWPWGEIRGGSPPVPYGLDHYITFFHSSTPATEGVWRRYWMGAYVFEAKAPFRVTQISPRPIAGGSERDNHGHDPRSPNSWKPFVVFPGGAIKTPNGWDVAMGVNDWRIAIAHLQGDPELVDPHAPRPVRYFKTRNSSRPVRLMRLDREPFWLEWESATGSQIGAPPGVAKMNDPWLAEELAEAEGVTEITKDEYERAVLNKTKRGAIAAFV